MKAVLPEEGSVSNLLTDSVSCIHSSSKPIKTLTVHKLSDEFEKESAKKEVRRPTSLSEEWVVDQVIKDDRTDMIGMHLRQWMNDSRHSEIDDELISHLKSLSKEQVQQAVKELKRPKPQKMIRGTHGNQLSLPVVIQT